MKKYSAYMDEVRVSPEFHKKLTGLSPRPRGADWKRYAGLAAALALALGLGAFGLGRLAPRPAAQEIGRTEPAIDVAPGSDQPAEGTRTIGGYEVRSGEISAYYVLPYVAYGQSTAELSLVDFALSAPEGSVRREVTAADIQALVGGADMVETHLAWQDFSWSGTMVICPDGSVWQLAAWGERADMACSLELLAGDAVPPDCVVTDDETVTQVWGVPVVGRVGGMYGRTAEDEGGEVWMPDSREVAFAANGAGLRFHLYGLEGEGQAVEEMVSRFVRAAISEGFVLDGWGLDGTVPVGAAPAAPAEAGPQASGAGTPAYTPGVG